MLTPGVRLLTADLRWQPIELISPGDRLIGFDEEQVPGARGRRFRTAIAQSAQTIIRPCSRITMGDGSSVIASTEHRWLTHSGGNVRWVRSGRRIRGTRLLSMGRWEEEDSKEAGWLAGMFDGEGYVGGGYKTSRAHHVGVAQREGPVAENVRRLLKARGFQFGDYVHGGGPNGVHQITVKGGIAEELRLLGIARPERLIAKAERLWADRRIERTPIATVVSVEPIGDFEVVALETSTRTFVADALLSHSSVPAVTCDA